MEQNRMKQNVYKMLFTVGIGGIFSCYLLELSRIKLLPLSEQLQRSIALGNIPEIHISSLEIMISFISVFAILSAPFFMEGGKKAGKRCLILLCFLFIDFCSLISVIVRGELFHIYIVVVWVSSICFVWMCFEILGVLYRWMKTESAGQTIDVVKLTFLWTIIAFILGKVW